jgi:hypothetical protein
MATSKVLEDKFVQVNVDWAQAENKGHRCRGQSLLGLTAVTWKRRMLELPVERRRGLENRGRWIVLNVSPNPRSSCVGHLSLQSHLLMIDSSGAFWK